MNNRYRDRLLLFAAVLLGLGISTGRPIGMMAAAGMPLACLAPGTRKTSFHSAFAYYVGALWPMIPGLEAYWKSELLIPFVLWILSAILLSVPWAIAWTSAHVHCLWRAPLALLATIIPPLGIVGLASPLTGAGYLFPGTSWLGLAVVALVPGVALSTQILQLRHRVVVLFSIIGVCAALSVGAVKLHSHDVKLPPGWIAVNTHFGDVSPAFPRFQGSSIYPGESSRSSCACPHLPRVCYSPMVPSNRAFLAAIDCCTAGSAAKYSPLALAYLLTPQPLKPQWKN